MEGAQAGSVGAANGQDRETRIAALRESIERHTVPSHPLAALKPHPRNSRVHPPAQLDEIERSMLEWGWTMPILADEDGATLAGHGRKMVATRLGLDEAPVIFATGWSDAQKRAYIIADNKLPENAEWDPAMLKLELQELETGGVDLALLGFDGAELGQLLGDAIDPRAEWTGMPEFDQQDKSAFRSIPVHFKDQAALEKFAAVTGMKITDQTRFLWYPEIEIERYMDKRYRSEP